MAALVPKPRVNLTRFNGVFAPNSKHRIQVIPAKRRKGRRRGTGEDEQCVSAAERRAAMTWGQRLKRLFNIDIEICPKCGGAVKIIACIEDPVVIDKILTHLDKQAASTASVGDKNFFLWALIIRDLALWVKKTRPQDLVIETCGLIMKVSVRGRTECGVSAARPDDTGRAENGEI